jgi:hypothetical protein
MENARKTLGMQPLKDWCRVQGAGDRPDVVDIVDRTKTSLHPAPLLMTFMEAPRLFMKVQQRA